MAQPLKPTDRAARLARDGTSPGGGTMEESVICIPMIEDSVIGLGDLWDCHSNTCPGNLFDKPILRDHVDAFPSQSMDYMLYKSKNSSDKLSTLNITAELTLDISFGGANKLHVSGNATYDSKDAKKFNQEELLCTYATSTYVVRLSPAARSLVSETVAQNISAQKIRATHYVESIRVGGQASASIRVTEIVDDQKMTLDGEFKGDLVAGPVTANSKATLEMLDEELAEHFTTEVNVKCRPPFSQAPTNVQQMFAEIDKVHDSLALEKHFKDQGLNHVVGVPLSFKLVPLAQIIDFDDLAKYTYKLLEEDLLREFMSMVFACQDYQQPGYIKGLLREKDARLVTLLRDDSNPFTVKVTDFEGRCARNAKICKGRAFETFTRYKDGDAKAADILTVIQEYNDYFDVMQLTADILALVEEGKRELSGVHAADVAGLAKELRFFTNLVDLADWWTAERRIKLLLQTSRDSASPSGTFLRLYDLSVPLGELGVEIGIAFPSISEDFSLTFKIQDKEVIYRDKDIVFALEVLGVAIEKGDLMSALFYCLSGVLSGLNMTSVGENLADITSLVSIFKESRGVAVCETYPQLLDILGRTNNEWNFVLPIQALNSCVETMKIFRQLRQLFPLQFPNLRHQWIVGKFNVEEASDSPVLFLFRDNVLRAICLDHLDVFVLLNQFTKSTTSPDLVILAHDSLKVGCLYPSRANFALKVLEGLVLDHSTTLTDIVPNLPAFPHESSKQLLTAIQVVRPCALRNELKVLNCLAKVSMEDYEELEYTYWAHGWTPDAGFPTLSSDVVKWEDLQRDLESFLGNQAPYLIQVEGAIKALKGLKVPEDGGAAEVEKIRAAIKEIIAFLTATFAVEDDDLDYQPQRVPRQANYMFRGQLIQEQEKFKDLKDIVDSFASSQITIQLRGILNAFEKFYAEELADEANNFFNLVQLIHVVETLATEQTFKPILVDLARKYCDRAVARLEGGDTGIIEASDAPLEGPGGTSAPSLEPFAKDKYAGAAKKINDSLAERNLFKALGHLASFAQHPHMYALTEQLYNLKTLHNVEPIKAIIETMRSLEFSDPQLKAFWTNPKFLYLIREGIENDALIKTIFVQICIEREPGDVPRFIPNDIAERLKPLFYYMDEPRFEWPTVWKMLATFVQALQVIVTRNHIPVQFPRVLREHVQLSAEIKQALVQVGALFHWDDYDKYFVHPWGLRTIKRALTLLQQAPTPKKLSNKPNRPKMAPQVLQSHPQPPTPEESRTITSELRAKSLPPSPGPGSAMAVTRQYSLVDKVEVDPSQLSLLPVTDPWKRFTVGGYLDKIGALDHLCIRRLLARPLVEYGELSQSMEFILPYLVQQAKMHNSSTSQPLSVVDYIKYPPTDGRPRPGFIDFEAGSSSKQRSAAEAMSFLMSRGDLITALFNSTDPLVAHHILCSMMKSPMALPLIIPSIVAVSNGYRFLLPALQNLVVTELEGVVPQPHLLQRPFRLVFAVRGGDSGAKLGKSTILNQLLMAHKNVFSCFAEPGVEHGRPVGRNGLVEFTWLAKSKTDGRFYEAVLRPHYASNQPDMVLLGNLHGDALSPAHQPLLEFIKTFTSAFVVFWKATNWNDLKAKKAELNKIIGGGGSVLDLVLYPDSTQIEHVGQQNIIGMATPEEAEASRGKLHNVFREAITSKPRIPAPMRSSSSSAQALAQDTATEDELTYADPSILDFMRQCKSNRNIPAFIKFKISQFEDDNISCPESHRAVEFIRTVGVAKVKEALVLAVAPPSSAQLPALLDQLTDSMLAILALPASKRTMAFTHFFYELDYLSRTSSQKATLRILKLRTEILETAGQLGLVEMIELQNEVKASLQRLQATTLTPQDIFRYLVNEESLQDALEDKYAQHLQSGFAIELFQPTYGPVMWSKPLASAIQAVPPDTRVFVVSALGLKAAGKSTLLNRLFGSEFSEGVAGATHGLQLRFVWVEDRLRKQLNCDAFCVVDSEGFGAPENLVDESADLAERDLASFILGISHLTLANVRGERMGELKDILEVAFATLTSINDMLLTPDLVLVQQEQEAQSTAPTTSSDDGEFVNEWNELMANVQTLTRENELRLGVRVREAYRMETLKQRAKHAELIQAIRPLTSNEQLNSAEYHADIQTLYSKIIAICQQSTQGVALGDWYKFTETFWAAIKSGRTSNQFKNAAQTRSAISLEGRVRGVKDAMDLAFRSHDKLIDLKFTAALDSYFEGEEDPRPSPNDKPVLQSIVQDVDEALDNVINSCVSGADGSACSECQQAFILREALREETFGLGRQRQLATNEGVTNYAAEVRASLRGKYKQRVVAKQIETGVIREGIWEELHTEWESCSKDQVEGWRRYKQYVSTLQTVIPADQLIDSEVEDEFASLPHLLGRLGADSPLPDLEKTVAFDLGYYNMAVESALNSPKREMLTWDKNDWLIAKMEDLPPSLLTDAGVSIYLVGMVRELQLKMIEILDTFQTICGEQLSANFKWEAHLWAIKTLKAYMGKRQVEWNAKHNPLVQLENRKSEFDKLFHEV